MKTKKITLRQAWLVSYNEIHEGFAFNISEESDFGFDALTGDIFTIDMKSFISNSWSAKVFYSFNGAMSHLNYENKKSIKYHKEQIEYHNDEFKRLTSK